MPRIVTIEDCPYEPQLSSKDYDTVVWLGAGFSRCVSKGELPLMKGFFRGIKHDNYPHLSRYLTSRCGTLDDANVETILQAVEQMQDCPLPQRLRHAILNGQNPERIREELEQFCIERLTYEEIDADHWAPNLLADANERTTVVTTNYDTLAEQILSARSEAVHCGPSATCHHCNMRAILQSDCSCDFAATPSLDGRNAPVLKLHGSIAWHVCDNDGCGIKDCLIAACDCSPRKQPKCTCCGEPGKPVIVLPSMTKSFACFPQLGRMWERAHAAVTKCRTFTVFGFSFPQSDCLVCETIRHAVAQSNVLREIIIIDVEPQPVAEKVVELLPTAKDVLVITCRVPSDGTKPAWILPAVAA